MSSKQSGTRALADFFTTTHRISGQVQTGPKPLSDLLNDRSQSYMRVSNVYVSRLDQAAEIGAHAPLAYLSKENLNFVIVPLRETRTPDRSRFAVQEHKVLITLPGFEVQGKFAGSHRIDFRSFSPATLDPFVTLTEATVQLIGMSEMAFDGEAILVNRVRLESFCLKE